MDEDFYTRRRANFGLVILLTVSILLLTAHLSNFVRGLKNFVYYIVAPTPQSANRVVHSGNDLFLTFKEVVSIHQDNLALRSALEKYTYLDSEFRQMKEENQRLRTLVGFPMPPERASVIARVVMREPGSWFQHIIIDKGSMDGIYLDAAVLSWAKDKPAVLGRVAEVREHSAKVVLITNVLSAMPVQLRQTGEDGLLEGSNGHRMRLSYLVPETRAAIGDEVVTSPLSTVFPPGIAIGQISDMVTAAQEAFRTAVVKPAVDFSSLREVVVLVEQKHGVPGEK